MTALRECFNIYLLTVKPYLSRQGAWFTRSSGSLPSLGEDSKQCYLQIHRRLNDANEEEDQPFDAKALVGVVTEALADKEREIQMYLAYRRDSDAQQVGADS